ncbi:MAG: hypothetical protein ACXWVJ_01635 [Caulobacteraceae bacterium]
MIKLTGLFSGQERARRGKPTFVARFLLLITPLSTPCFSWPQINSLAFRSKSYDGMLLYIEASTIPPSNGFAERL